ncbi:universal stress protein [Mycobacterium sp. 21AC1]|uniref:universal stress protein n=1 Tax=[Mycobacterium] appelbergii TaxID=2939269 RepID=UPI0029390539|nr:universal stress protein [Mycobacterium sp. 21AC1]MDV3124215.1 universal stress protein [Mycobacterium sp. 21AC1]
MRPLHAVVVGIDGSRTAVDAALWAIREALSRDVPLLLLYAVGPAGTADDHHDASRALAAAEAAVRQRFTGESSEGPVKIEQEVVRDNPVRALIAASHTAAMVCVGTIGLKHASRGRIGSTAAGLVKAAHCPVAVVRASAPQRDRRVVVEVDGRPSSAAVLQTGVDEALLRGAPLCVLATWQNRNREMYDASAVADRNRLAQAQLDRRLSRWRRQHPGLEVETITGHRSILEYLAAHRESVQLAVVGAERAGGTGELAGPPGIAVLAGSDCSLLTCHRQQRL